MRTRVIVLTLCVCVCLEFAAFNSRLYIKYDIPVYFSTVFRSLQSLNGSEGAFILEVLFT